MHLQAIAWHSTTVPLATHANPSGLWAGDKSYHRHSLLKQHKVHIPTVSCLNGVEGKSQGVSGQDQVPVASGQLDGKPTSFHLWEYGHGDQRDDEF